MANPTDIAALQADVTNIGNASWSWHALTPDAKVINRTCYGLIFQWLPKSIIPSYFKGSISNTDVTHAYPNVKDKIVTLLVNAPKLQDTCEKATANMNVLIDRINQSRPQASQLERLDMLALIALAKVKVTPADPNASNVPTNDGTKPQSPLRSPTTGGRRNSASGSRSPEKPGAPLASPILPTSPRATLGSPTKLKPGAPLRTPEQQQPAAANDSTSLAALLGSVSSPNQTIRDDTLLSPVQPQPDKPPRVRNPIVSPDESLSELLRTPEQPQPAPTTGQPNPQRGRARRESQAPAVPTRRSPRSHSTKRP